MKLKSHIPITVDIGESEPLKLGVKRLGIDEKTKLTAKQRVAENAKDEERDDAWVALIIESFRRYVRVEGELIIECEDGDISVKKGEDLLTYFGGSLVILREIFTQLLIQNSLTDDQKKALRSLGGSSASSEGQEKEVPGEKPAPTATRAENVAFAETAGATDPETAQSGSTDQSSSTSAPFDA